MRGVAVVCACLAATSCATDDDDRVHHRVVSPTEISSSDQAAIDAFDTFAAEFRKERRIPSLSVAVVKDGAIVFARGYGFQDHDAEEDTTAGTTYLAASISKTFTAATLIAMDADGHIDLDAPFTTLSDWGERCEWLTTSGVSIFGGGTLGDGTVIEPPKCDVPISLRDVLRHRVNGEPGSSFFYNPIVFGRLSNWIEENTDKPFREWMDHYVIDKAGLRNVAAGWRDEDKGHVLTQLAPPFAYVAAEGGRPRPSILPNTELNASSGIIASVIGLAEYSIALDEGRILSPRLREEMWTPPIDPDGSPAPYAYGWYVQDWRGERLVWHGGWWPDAYAGLLLKAPDAGLTLVALSNADGLRDETANLNTAQIELSALARKWLELFVAE